MTETQKQFRPINQSLGQQPSLGPIPAYLLAPSSMILVGSYLLTQIVLSLGFAWFLLVSLWGICTWWVVVGEKMWKFTHKFISAPDWHRGYVQYIRCLSDDEN
jgi:hypothetical protein